MVSVPEGDNWAFAWFECDTEGHITQRLVQGR